MAIIGILVAFWSASGCIAAFTRASNVIYDIPEGRPIAAGHPTEKEPYLALRDDRKLKNDGTL